MDSVSVATLKSKLSWYLAAVKKGKEIVVTSHRHPVARLLPLRENSRATSEIVAASKPVSALKQIKGMRLKSDPVAFLLADRRRR